MSIKLTVIHKSFAVIVDNTAQDASDSTAIEIRGEANYVHMEMLALTTDPDFLNRLISESVGLVDSFAIQHYKSYPGYLDGFALNGASLGGQSKRVTVIS